MSLRLSGLAEITRRPREAIRNYHSAGTLPWHDDKPAGTHRRFDGFHGLALVLVEMLTARGEKIEDAAAAVLDQNNVLELFLDEVADGAAEDRFVALLTYATSDSLTGVRFQGTALAWTGTAAEVQDLLAGALQPVGHVRKRNSGREVRTIGGPYIAIASVREAYRLLKARAEAAGYLIDGRRVARLAPVADDEGDD